MNENKTIDVLNEGPLGLKSVLVGSLPGSLIVNGELTRYTVEAVFTRRAKAAEVTQIMAQSTRERLAREGYPDAHLQVSDRRLLIHQTNLEELRDGLATVIAETLAEIAAGVLREERLAILAAELNDERELQRAKAVLALAESIDFSLPVSYKPQSASSDEQAPQSAEVSDWDDEGGRSDNPGS